MITVEPITLAKSPQTIPRLENGDKLTRREF